MNVDALKLGGTVPSGVFAVYNIHSQQYIAWGFRSKQDAKAARDMLSDDQGWIVTRGPQHYKGISTVLRR